MLKMTCQRFAVLTLSTALAASAGVASAQLSTPTPAPPRQDTPRSNTAEPAADSRAGGALAEDVDPVGGAEIVDEDDVDAAADARASEAAKARRARAADRGVDDVTVPDVDPAAPGLNSDVKTTSFIGPVVDVGEGTVTVQLAPPRVSTPKKQKFTLRADTPVIVDGKQSTLVKIRKGSTVRIEALLGDPTVAARVVVGTVPAARPAAADREREAPESIEPPVEIGEAGEMEDVDTNFDIYPERDQNVAQTRRDRERMRRPIGAEEAVLPLGIEVYGVGSSGALVTEMLANGVAAQAGMLPGDLLVAVNRKPIPDPELIEQMMAAPDSTAGVELSVIRNGQPLTFTVNPVEVLSNGLVTEAAIQEALVGHGIVADGGADAVLPLGATGFENFADGGVSIMGTEDRLARGLLPNDVIMGINGQPIRNRDDLMQALQGLPGDAENFRLDLMRNGERTSLNLPSSLLNAPQFGTAGQTGSRSLPQTGSNFGTGTNPGTNTGTGTNPGVVPQRPGRSGATVAPTEGRSGAREGSITEGRSGAAPGNNLPGTTPPNLPESPTTGNTVGGTGGVTGGTTGGTGGTTGGAGGTPQ